MSQVQTSTAGPDMIGPGKGKARRSLPQPILALTIGKAPGTVANSSWLDPTSQSRSARAREGHAEYARAVLPRLVPPDTRPAAGFTLIEVLIALVLTGLVVATVAQAVALVMQEQRTQARAVSRRDELDTVERTLRSLIERADPGGVTGRLPLFVGESRALTFTSTLPIASVGQITRLVDVTVTSDTDHRLVVSWAPHLPNLINPDATRGRTVLLDGVERLEFSYWQPVPGVAGGAWLTRWTSLGLPPLIRVRIALRSPAGANFPDIVVRPERDRWQP
jgi:general secretion pathway protein J